MRFIHFLLLVVFFSACLQQQLDSGRKLFSDITEYCGVEFSNQLTYTDTLNPYTYRNFFNGAGVAIGDINNDGLQDIYFTGNQVGNKLYLNLGQWKFKDITAAAGVECKGAWSTGASFIDINGDGLLDLYVCKSGSPNTPHRHNELFVNNGDLTFSERSKEFGLDFTGLAIQAAFFDYDRDGDLDCYLLTNSFKQVGVFDLVKDQRQMPDPENGGNKFLLNTGNKFVDYSAEANIYRSSIGFGLGITLGDFNDDGWTDVYISNDFFERDYLYINNQRGGFDERLTDFFESISMGSMGADFADLDNDGDKELFVTEMLPDSLSRKKSKTVFENWNRYQLNVKAGYHHQFSRNVLQKKIMPGKYVEIGRMAGVAATEWSWGALLFDMDNDGWKDIFVANGILKDLLDRDYLAFTGAEENVRRILSEGERGILKLIELMPSSKFSNYAFKNKEALSFENNAKAWGLDAAGYSSGSAYGDLDNDGDLDLVVNNINSRAGVFKNNTDTSRFKSLTISLSSQCANRFAIGAEVVAHSKGQVRTIDNFVSRGYQSSVQPKITLGLGQNIDEIDSIIIKWPSGNVSKYLNVTPNSWLHLVEPTERHQAFNYQPRFHQNPRLNRVYPSVFHHLGNGLVDFNRDRMLPVMFSNETPKMIKGDIDGDGIEEVYLGGGKEQSGVFLHFDKNIRYTKATEKYKLSEETRGALFDADQDGDLDFYLASGGRFYPKSSTVLMDRLFINNGKGIFTESMIELPFLDFVSTSVVEPIDFDKDGDIDLFVGERFDPFAYGTGGRGYVLENKGAATFVDATLKVAPDLINLGMITDARAIDVNQDNWADLVVVGDWMPVTILVNERGSLKNMTSSFRLDETTGWWNTVEVADLNQDGKPDLLCGNLGLNSFFKVSDRAYVADFDGNGSVEPIFCSNVGGIYYPYADKDDFVSQLPSYKKQALYYNEYSRKSLEDLVPPQVLKKAKILELKMLESVIFLSTESGFRKIIMPREAQYSPIYSFLTLDFDRDGVDDIIAGGNQYFVRPQFGRYDASCGWLFKGVVTKGDYVVKPGLALGINGQIRDITNLNVKTKEYLLFAKYDDELEIFEIQR